MRGFSAFGPHDCWHTSLNKFLIILPETPLFTGLDTDKHLFIVEAEAPPPPPSATGVLQCSGPSRVRGPMPAVPAVTLAPISNGSGFRCYCTSHESPPAFKTLHPGLCSPIWQSATWLRTLSHTDGRIITEKWLPKRDGETTKMDYWLSSKGFFFFKKKSTFKVYSRFFNCSFQL